MLKIVIAVISYLIPRMKIFSNTKNEIEEKYEKLNSRNINLHRKKANSNKQIRFNSKIKFWGMRRTNRNE